MAVKTHHHQECIRVALAENTYLDMALNPMVMSNRKDPWMYCREYLVIVYALIVAPMTLIGHL